MTHWYAYDGRHTFDNGVCGELLDETALLVCVKVEVQSLNGGNERKKKRKEKPHFGGGGLRIYSKDALERSAVVLFGTGGAAKYHSLRHV